jgi:hypothetical protein
VQLRGQQCQIVGEQQRAARQRCVRAAGQGGDDVVQGGGQHVVAVRAGEQGKVQGA